MMQTSPEGRAYIERKEGLRLHAYQDIAGVWTIGYGDTGPDIVEGLVWTKEQCDEALSRRLEADFEPAINRVCSDVPTTQGQFDGMVSLAYNIGIGAFSRSTVARCHRDGEYDKAADAFELFDHVNGRVNDALHERRVEEGQMYADASPSRSPVPIQEQNSKPDIEIQGGHQKAVVASLTGPSIGVLSWWANTRHGLGIPEHVVADMVGLVSGALVWLVPSSGGWRK